MCRRSIQPTYQNTVKLTAPKLISLMSRAWRDLPSKYDATTSPGTATATTYTTVTTDLSDAVYPQPDPQSPFFLF